MIEERSIDSLVRASHRRLWAQSAQLIGALALGMVSAWGAVLALGEAYGIAAALSAVWCGRIAWGIGRRVRRRMAFLHGVAPLQLPAARVVPLQRDLWPESPPAKRLVARAHAWASQPVSIPPVLSSRQSLRSDPGEIAIECRVDYGAVATPAIPWWAIDCDDDTDGKPSS